MTITARIVSDPIHAFLAELEQSNRRPASLRAYASDLTHVETWLQRPLVSMREFEFRRYISQQRHLRPASLRRRIIACKRFFSWAEQHDLVEIDPSGNVLPPKVDAEAPVHLGVHEVDRLLNQLPGDTPVDLRNRSIVWLLYYSGMRIGELQALNVSDLIWDTLQVRVVGRGSKERVVPLNRNVIGPLQAWLRERGAAIGFDDGPLFISLSRTLPNGRLAYGVVRQIVKEALATVGLGHVNPHQLRHTFATQLLDRGAGLDQVAALLGHARVDTAKKYVKAPSTGLRHAVDLLG